MYIRLDPAAATDARLNRICMCTLIFSPQCCNPIPRYRVDSVPYLRSRDVNGRWQGGMSEVRDREKIPGEYESDGLTILHHNSPFLHQSMWRPRLRNVGRPCEFWQQNNFVSEFPSVNMTISESAGVEKYISPESPGLAFLPTLGSHKWLVHNSYIKIQRSASFAILEMMPFFSVGMILD